MSGGDLPWRSSQKAIKNALIVGQADVGEKTKENFPNGQLRKEFGIPLVKIY